MIDLSRVRYIDAGGFSTLIEAQKRMTARSDKLYIVVNDFVQRLFSILKLDTCFDLYVSADDARFPRMFGVFLRPRWDL